MKSLLKRLYTLLYTTSNFQPYCAQDHAVETAVTFQWTGTLDWHNFVQIPIHAIKTLFCTPQLVAKNELQWLRQQR